MSLPWGEMPYDTKIPAEVVYDYAVTRGDLLDSYARRQLADWIERYAAHAVADAIAQERAAQASGPGWFWTQTEWAEWSNELASLIPEDDVGRYANVDGAQESIIEDCLRAYVVERAAWVAATGETTPDHARRAWDDFAAMVDSRDAAWVAKIEALADDFHNRGTEADRRHEPNAYARRAAWDRASELVRALLPSDATEALDTEAGR